MLKWIGRVLGALGGAWEVSATVAIFGMPMYEDYSEEAAEWADVKMKRDFSAGYEEAEADEDAPDHVTEEDE